MHLSSNQPSAPAHIKPVQTKPPHFSASPHITAAHHRTPQSNSHLGFIALQLTPKHFSASTPFSPQPITAVLGFKTWHSKPARFSASRQGTAPQGIATQPSASIHPVPLQPNSRLHFRPFQFSAPHSSAPAHIKPVQTKAPHFSASDHFIPQHYRAALGFSPHQPNRPPHLGFNPLHFTAEQTIPRLHFISRRSVALQTKSRLHISPGPFKTLQSSSTWTLPALPAHTCPSLGYAPDPCHARCHTQR